MKKIFILFVFTSFLHAISSIQGELDLIRVEIFDIECNENLSKKQALEKSESVLVKLDRLKKFFPNRAEPVIWKAQVLLNSIPFLDDWERYSTVQQIDILLVDAIDKTGQFDHGRAHMLRALLHSKFSGYLKNPLSINDIDLLFSQAHGLNQSKDIPFHYAFFMLKSGKPYHAVSLFRDAKNSELNLGLTQYESYYNKQCDKAFGSIRL